MQTHQHYIGGRWVESAATLPIINPSDGQEIGRIARGTAADVDAAVTAAQAARDGAWGQLTAVERGRLLLRLSALILRDTEALARMESTDVGKPLSQARTDVIVCARYFEYYGAAADKVHGDTIPFQSGFTVMTVWEPHGVTAHIVPWNYPLQMTGRSVAPALAMGNAIVLKPAEDTSLTALALARLAEEAGFPPGAFNVVTGLGEEVGAALSAHPGISHISFTAHPDGRRAAHHSGDPGTGWQIAAGGFCRCGSRRRSRDHHPGDHAELRPDLQRRLSRHHRGSHLRPLHGGSR
jgi:aldehyde dehydrogenase (NAD+)